MRPSAMETKLKVKPIMGALVHTAFWEGPCRAGKKEDLMPGAELDDARKRFEENKKLLEQLNPRVEIQDPVFVPYDETFVIEDKILEEINKDIHETDVILLLGQRIPKIERFNTPVICYTHAVSGADVCAYLRSIGRECHYAIGVSELKEQLHLQWVRKALSKTRVLMLTAGEIPTWGLLSNIKDYEKLRARYGFEVVRIPYTEIFTYMDEVDESQAHQLADDLASGAEEKSRVKPEFLVNDIKYYLAAKKMMEFHGCNAFTTACVELCRSRVPQERKFTPCVTHSLLKDSGYPSACEEDLNALLAMTVMMYTAERPAFMGNPLFGDEETISIHHSVPCLKMNGFNADNKPYKIFSFTVQGFGAKLQIGFTDEDTRQVTICRFDPTGEKMLLKTGEVTDTVFTDSYCSPFYFVRVDDARKYIHNMMDFGHHQVMIVGDYARKLKAVARLLDFEIIEG